MNQSLFKISKEEIEDLAYKVRKDLIELMYRSGSGHLDTSLSLVEIWTSLVNADFFNFDPKNGAWEERDRVFLSEGHACPLQYILNGYLGYYNVQDVFQNFRLPKSPFQGHTVRNLDCGFENSNGSLGIGIWHAYGQALETDSQVFCVAGDGEFQEPPAFSIFNVTHNLKPVGNFHLIINNNRLAQDSEVDIGPLKEVAVTYNWQLIEVNGHDINALGEAWSAGVASQDQPTLIICDTVKGYGGDPERADKLGSHGVPPKNEEEYKAYLAGLESMRSQS